MGTVRVHADVVELVDHYGDYHVLASRKTTKGHYRIVFDVESEQIEFIEDFMVMDQNFLSYTLDEEKQSDMSYDERKWREGDGIPIDCKDIYMINGSLYTYDEIKDKNGNTPPDAHPVKWCEEEKCWKDWKP